MTLTAQVSPQDKQQLYQAVQKNINALIAGESDEIALMATIVCELHHAFGYFHWTGFYRVVAPNLLKIGPYQGTHGCLEIAFDRGVCGAAARRLQTQIVDDVHQHPDHIACSISTRSEIVVPVFNTHRQLIGVLDVDSNNEASFDQVDRQFLESIVRQAFLLGA